MAPKDPLLGTLKGKARSNGQTMTDSSPHLSSCCELLELVLRKGLQQPVLSLVQRDYWQCLEQIPLHDTCGRLSAVSLAVEQTRACKKLLSAQGRGRYLLRLALSRKILPQFINHLLHTPRILEPFMSLLLVLSHMDFKLDMEVSVSHRSHYRCLCVRYLHGRVFVLELTPGSQAYVDKFICPGDIIDEINGTSLRNSKNGQAGVVLSRLKGVPLSIRVVRWQQEDGTVYRPLIKLLRALRTDNPGLQLTPAPSQHKEIVYIVQYLGKANIGMFGGKEVLQHAIPQVLHKNLPSKEVLLDLKETHLTCTDRNTKTFEHHYPEISCVGRYSKPDYTTFAFCVADSPETPHSTGFCCVVLKASSIKECEDIVCRIATGFKHTEWFV
uniref:RUN domain-containing protein n=1 Tax=Periophthalmus magnuspinnatus TaxID=409849 RepID=A0A3B4BDX3_9GOBI